MTLHFKQCHKGDQCVNPQGSWLPLGEFHHDGSRKDGLCSNCKACVKQYHQINSQKLSAYSRQWQLDHPEKAKQHRADYRKRHQGKYPKYVNSEKRREYQRLYSRKRRSLKKRAPDFYIKNRIRGIRYRARKYENEGNHTSDDIKALLIAQKGRCYWCGNKTDTAFHVDHVIPLSRGGSNDPSNLVISCPFCNQSKGSKLPHEWFGNNGKMF